MGVKQLPNYSTFSVNLTQNIIVSKQHREISSHIMTIICDCSNCTHGL